jgi:hypothetical protein
MQIDGVHVQLELGPWWTVEAIDELLARTAARELSPGERLLAVAEPFLRENTPYQEESSLEEPPDGTIRVRLETFDCITFIYTIVALAGAASFAELVRRLLAIRYDGPPARDRLIHYAWNSARRMIDLGLVRDVTAELVEPARLGVRTVRLGILPDGRPFLPHGSCGDWNLGQEVSARFIPTALVRAVEPRLQAGDVMLLIASKDPGEYPGIVAHAVVVFKKPDDEQVYVLHSGKTRVGDANGRQAGVALLTYWDPERQALRNDSVHRPFHLYLEGSPHLWQGIVVLRPQPVPITGRGAA